jgi:hypothetical protein
MPPVNVTLFCGVHAVHSGTSTATALLDSREFSGERNSSAGALPVASAALALSTRAKGGRVGTDRIGGVHPAGQHEGLATTPAQILGLLRAAAGGGSGIQLSPR